MIFAPLFRLLLAGLLLAGAGAPARALQLGETKAQTLARHGEPGAEDRGKGLAIYFWEGWSAELEYQEDAVQKLIYRRNAYLAEAEIAALLQSNGGAAQWREVTARGEVTRRWLRADGATAGCLAGRPLMITFQTAPPQATGPALYGGSKTTSAAPEPPPFTPATFPKLLDPEITTSAVESRASAPLPRTEPRVLPKLHAEEIAAPAAARGGELAAPDDVRPTPMETNALEPARSPAENSHAPLIILGALLTLGAAAGGTFYFRQKRARAENTSPVAPSIPPARRIPADSAPAQDSALDAVRADQFDLVVGEIFRREGYTVEISAAVPQDDAIDLTLRRGSEMILVQCNHWKAPRVTEREIRAFYGAMTAGGAPRGILVTAGIFSAEARTFAEGKEIDLMDRAALEECIALVAQPAEKFCDVGEWIEEFTAQARVFDPECPICQGSMVIRHHRSSGAAAWNCRQHPRCPGRRAPRLDLLAATSATAAVA